MADHVARSGDCVESIAYRNGLFWETVWNHERNASLRELREDPVTLAPGDQVFVPEIRVENRNADTDRRHRFRRKGVPSRVKLRLLDHAGEPRANLDYILEIDDQSFTGTSDPQGYLEHPIDPDARQGKLHLPKGEVHELKLGGLDPVELLSGLQARLTNLGFYRGVLDGEMNEATEEAIQAFQIDVGIEPTGVPDEETRNRLMVEHGE